MDGKLVRSLGFNGFPPSCEDRPEWLENRDIKYKLVIHAETNAILHSGHSVVGCTVYTYPLAPCPECAKFMAVAGIKRIVSGIDLGASSTRKFLDTSETEFILKANNIDFEIHRDFSTRYPRTVQVREGVQQGEHQ